MTKEHRSETRREFREILARRPACGLTHFAFSETEAFNIYTLKSWHQRENLEQKAQGTSVANSQFASVELPNNLTAPNTVAPFCIRMNSSTIEYPRFLVIANSL